MARKAKKLPDLDVGDVLDEAYNGDDRLLISNFQIDSEEDLRYLREIEIRYAFVVDNNGEPTEETIYEDKIDSDEDPAEPLERFEGVEQTYEELVDETEELFEQLQANETQLNDLTGVRNLTEQLVDETVSFPSGVNLLNQLRSRNPASFTHSVNVSLLSVLYGYKHDFSKERLLDLGLGALLHDIGKTELPEEILRKKDKLNEEERELIETHPTEGYKLLRKSGCRDTVKRIVLEHHERPDGSGYPRGTTEMHELSLIVSVIEVYEALRADQTYRDSLDPLEAYEQLIDEFADQEETQAVLRNLVKAFGVFPVGSFVKLSNGYVGVVMENNENHPKYPVIKVVGAPDESLEEIFELDLKKTKNHTFAKQSKIYDEDVEIEKVLDASNQPELKERIPNYFKDRLQTTQPVS